MRRRRCRIGWPLAKSQLLCLSLHASPPSHPFSNYHHHYRSLTPAAHRLLSVVHCYSPSPLPPPRSFRRTIPVCAAAATFEDRARCPSPSFSPSQRCDCRITNSLHRCCELSSRASLGLRTSHTSPATQHPHCDRTSVPLLASETSTDPPSTRPHDHSNKERTRPHSTGTRSFTTNKDYTITTTASSSPQRRQVLFLCNPIICTPTAITACFDTAA